jgi:signal transduction histidine kinase
MITHDLDKNVFELRADALSILVVVSFITCSVFFVGIILSQEFQLLVPLGVTAGLLMVSNSFKQRQKIETAAWWLILAQIAGPSVFAVIRGPDALMFMFLLLPIVATSLLIDGKLTMWIAALCIILMLALTIPQKGFVSTLNLVIIPSIMSILIGGIAYLNEYNILQMVFWALDIQQKDTQRAEMFYKQGEELKQALLEVQHSRSALEKLHNELKEAQRKTEQASKAKSIFLSNMSHELRTPLNVVIGYTSAMLNMPQMYENTTLPDIFRNDIQQIKDNGHYLIGLINDILDLSKIEAGKLELHPDVVDLAGIFKGAMATCVGLIKDKTLQLRSDYPETLPLVWADPIRVRQIILNLTSNAIKFTQSGSVTLQAHIEDKFVRVSISDTGIGIPEHALQHIFDRFQQAEHDTDKQYGGTGLGLDISKQLVQMHGGNLTVESQVGHGSTFSFTLPLLGEDQKKSDSPLTDMNSSVTMLEPAPQAAVVGYTILLVEDETSMREMMRRTLEGAEHVVIDTHDGTQVLEMAVGLLPDLIILDVHLPGANGWDVLKTLKTDETTGTIPVMICTANDDKDHAKELGAALYLRKPFSPDELLACIQGLLTGSLA